MVVNQSLRLVRRMQRLTWVPHSLNRVQRALLLKGSDVRDRVVDSADGVLDDMLPHLPEWVSLQGSVSTNAEQETERPPRSQPARPGA